MRSVRIAGTGCLEGVRRAVSVGSLVVFVALAGCSSGVHAPAGSKSNAAAAPTPAAPPGLGQPPETSGRLGAVYHSADGYRIAPPIGWLRYPVPPRPDVSISFASTAVDRSSSVPVAGSLQVTVFPHARALSDLVRAILERYRVLLPGYVVTLDQPITLPGGDAARLVGLTVDDPTSVPKEFLQIMTVHDGKAYCVIITASAKDFTAMRSVFRDALATFAFEPAGSDAQLEAHSGVGPR